VFVALAASGATREEDLAALRSRIGTLQAELDEKESSRRESRSALRASETAISRMNRDLRALDAQARDAQAQVKAIGERRRAAEARLGHGQAALGRMLAASYLAGAPGVLRLLLSGDDPHDVARQLHYASIVSAATARAVASQRAALADLESLRRGAIEQSARLEAIERGQREERKLMLDGRRERQRVLDGIAGDLRLARREIRVLQADEARLSRVVTEIARVLNTRPGAGHRPGAVERVPEPGATSGPFSRLRGKLRLPVRGELIGRFGAQHGETPGTRKGVFIRSSEGESVRAVAAGSVVYADWMRGFGNLLIVDHGESYLSIYANNESLLKQAGEAVAAGDPLATVGSSGGNDQTGLYFELRHLGKAFDPLRWVGR
jgi:septal ring factor EnvC (AmiA/AmiB activator)